VNFMKEYMQLTKGPSIVDDKATPSADYPLAETGVDEVRDVHGEYPGEHDDQPLVRLFGHLIKMDNMEKEDPHSADPGPKPEDPHHKEDRLFYLNKLKDKTDFGDVLVPDSTHLQDRQQELTHHVVEYDAMHMDTKYETNLKKIETHLEEVKNANTDNAEMLADGASQ
jgi:hypothetical protein